MRYGPKMMPVSASFLWCIFYMLSTSSVHFSAKETTFIALLHCYCCWLVTYFLFWYECLHNNPQRWKSSVLSAWETMKNNGLSIPFFFSLPWRRGVFVMMVSCSCPYSRLLGCYTESKYRGIWLLALWCKWRRLLFFFQVPASCRTSGLDICVAVILIWLLKY